MKAVLTIVVWVVLFLIIGDTTIQLKPFKISIVHWYRPVAIVFMILALIIYTAGERARGYKDGLKYGINEIEKQKE